MPILQDIRLTTGVGGERLRTTEFVPIVCNKSLHERATALETNAPGFNVLIEEDVMKSQKIVLTYQNNQLKAFEVPGLAERLVKEYSAVAELELGICKPKEEPMKEEARDGELLAAVVGLEQVLNEEGVPVQTPHSIEPKNAALFFYWTAKEGAILSPSWK